MTHDMESTEASRDYTAAYFAHYTAKDLPAAVRLYNALMESYPDSPEADYSRMQVQNIVNAVVPKQEVYDAQMTLALLHLRHNGTLGA